MKPTRPSNVSRIRETRIQTRMGEALRWELIQDHGIDEQDRYSPSAFIGGTVLGEVRDQVTAHQMANLLNVPIETEAEERSRRELEDGLAHLIGAMTPAERERLEPTMDRLMMVQDWEEDPQGEDQATDPQEEDLHRLANRIPQGAKRDSAKAAAAFVLRGEPAGPRARRLQVEDPAIQDAITASSRSLWSLQAGDTTNAAARVAEALFKVSRVESGLSGDHVPALASEMGRLSESIHRGDFRAAAWAAIHAAQIAAYMSAHADEDHGQVPAAISPGDVAVAEAAKGISAFRHGWTKTAMEHMVTAAREMTAQWADGLIPFDGPSRHAKASDLEAAAYRHLRDAQEAAASGVASMVEAAAQEALTAAIAWTTVRDGDTIRANTPPPHRARKTPAWWDHGKPTRVELVED